MGKSAIRGGGGALNDDTKILTKTDTETFFTIPNFPKPRLFSDTKFSETETFFRYEIFPKPKLILFFRDQIFRYRNRDFFPKPKPKPSNIWQKFRNREVSKPKCQSLLMRFEGTNYDVFSSSLIPVTRWFS